MLFGALLSGWLCSLPAELRAQEPLYVVNGRVVSGEEFRSLNLLPESIETLPADEETIARFGPGAGNGVILITLPYDTPARFRADGRESFRDWVAAHVVWKADEEPRAHVALRLTVDETGRATIDKVMRSTEKRFLRRVRKAVEQAPAWEVPALKNGAAVPYAADLFLTLPQ